MLRNFFDSEIGQTTMVIDGVGRRETAQGPDGQRNASILWKGVRDRLEPVPEVHEPPTDLSFLGALAREATDGRWAATSYAESSQRSQRMSRRPVQARQWPQPFEARCCEFCCEFRTTSCLIRGSQIQHRCPEHRVNATLCRI